MSFSNDLPEGCHIQAFTDDVLLLMEAHNITDLQDAANNAITKIIEWGKSVKLDFGLENTNLISFTKKSQESNS